MAQFCECGSLVINGSCTNKKCDRHYSSKAQLATYSQLTYIRHLKSRLGLDIGDLESIEFEKKATFQDASELIDELKAELGE